MKHTLVVTVGFRKHSVKNNGGRSVKKYEESFGECVLHIKSLIIVDKLKEVWKSKEL